MINRTHWALFAGVLCAATVARAQLPTIAISSLQGAPLNPNGDARPSPLAPAQPEQVYETPVSTAAITTGANALPARGFVLLINGTNLSNDSDTFDYVQWTDPAAGTSYQIGYSPDSVGAFVYSVASTQILVYIPPALYSKAVASPDSVEIQVFESPPPSDFGQPLQSSNIATFTLNPPLALPASGAALPPGLVGSSYSQAFFSGGSPPYGPNTLASGALPPGLPVPAASQVLAGTPTAAGSYSFTLSAADEWGNTITLRESLTIAARLQILTTGLPFVQAGTSYNVTLAAMGGFPPYTWSAAGLPPNISLNPLTGLLSGIAPAPGTYTFAFTVRDSTGAIAFVTLQQVFLPAPLIFVTTTPLPAGVVGTTYATAFQVTGGVPGYQFAVIGGSLPGGLAFSPNGVLSGIPTAYGQFSFTVQVTDSTGASTSLGFALSIRPAPLAITTGTLPTEFVGAPISIAFAASGGAPPYSFSGTGSFPPGASLSGTGVLTAPAPTAAGSYTFLVSVGDTQGNSTSKSFTLTVSVAALVITTTSPLANATVGTAYSVSFAASGGTSPYTWTALGVPAGLGFSSAGVLSGTPTSAGSSTLVVMVTDSTPASPLAGTAGPLTASGGFALTVSPAKLTITTTSLANGTVGVAYSASFSATGGVTPYTWSLSGFPTGLVGNSSGAISGTPMAPATATVTATVTDSTGAKATASVPLTVTALPLTITTTSLPNGVVGSSYSASLAATGGVPPYSWTIGGLPAGVNSSGSSLSGTPTAAGPFQVSVTVKDSVGTTASASFPVTIALPSSPAATITGPPSGTGPASQPPVQLSIASPFPLPITVNLTLTFAPVTGGDDPSIQFSTGGRTAQETIAAGSTLALPALAIQTGTVAGAITVTAQLLAGTEDITPNPAPSTTIVIASMAPVITSVTVVASTGGFTIDVVGYSTPRQVTQAVLQFTPAAGTTLSSSSFTIPTTSLFTTWYGSSAAAPFGSQFTLTQPFTVLSSASAVSSVSVVLSNGQGNSNTVSAAVP